MENRINEKINILAVGNFSSIYIRDSWVEPLKELYNAQIVDVIPFVAGKNFDSSYCIKYLESLLRNGAFDFIFFYSDGMHPTLFDPDSFFNAAKAKGVKVVAFHADDEPDWWYGMNKRFDYRYDVIATHSRRGYEKRIEEGWRAEQLFYMQWGYNPKVFYNMNLDKKEYDVIFIGKCKLDAKTGKGWEDGLQRDFLLEQLMEFCKEKGLRFGLFGFGWDKHPKFSRAYGGALSNEEMVRTYNTTKIVFNPAYSADEDFKGYQTKLRHFEVAGCRAFQITNENPELAKLFKPDEHVCYFKDKEDLFKKVLYYVENDEEREKIAENAFKEAQNAHTTNHRISALFDHVSKVYPPKIKSSVPIPVIKKVLITTKAKRPDLSIENFLGEIEQYKGSCDYIHVFISQADSLSIATDYRPVYNLLKGSARPDFISLRSIVRTSPTTENFIQVHRFNYNGVIITNDRAKDFLDYELEGSFDEYINPFKTEQGERIYLFNYLLRPEKAKVFIDSIENSEALSRLDIAHSFMVVNDIFIGSPPSLEVPYFSFNENIKKFYENLIKLNKTLMIYGARGELSALFFERVKKSKVKFLGFIDRAVRGTVIEGYEVYDKEDIESLLPDVIIISATVSATAIYKDIAHLNHKICIINGQEFSKSIWECGL